MILPPSIHGQASRRNAPPLMTPPFGRCSPSSRAVARNHRRVARGVGEVRLPSLRQLFFEPVSSLTSRWPHPGGSSPRATASGSPTSSGERNGLAAGRLVSSLAGRLRPCSCVTLRRCPLSFGLTTRPRGPRPGFRIPRLESRVAQVSVCACSRLSSRGLTPEHLPACRPSLSPGAILAPRRSLSARTGALLAQTLSLSS